MNSDWRTRPMRREGKIVWVLYRLADASAADEAGNREYWPRDERPAWAEYEMSARHMAGALNELEKLRRRKGGERCGKR